MTTKNMFEKSCDFFSGIGSNFGTTAHKIFLESGRWIITLIVTVIFSISLFVYYLIKGTFKGKGVKN